MLLSRTHEPYSGLRKNTRDEGTPRRETVAKAGAGWHPPFTCFSLCRSPSAGADGLRNGGRFNVRRSLPFPLRNLLNDQILRKPVGVGQQKLLCRR